jgi:hypothetical protein
VVQPFTVRGKTYSSYEEFLAENISVLEKIGDAFSGLDERLDFLNKTMLRVELALAGIEVPPGEELPEIPEIPGYPSIEIPDPRILLRDAVLVDITLDLRRFLIMLYRLGRAYEVRLFSYLEIGASETSTYTYNVPSDYIYIPHIEKVDYGIQRVITRRDYEGGDLKNTETYALDMAIEWGMTPLSKIVTGSFAVSYENTGPVDTWVKSRFIGTLLIGGDYLWWRKTVRTIGDKYIGLTT